MFALYFRKIIILHETLPNEGNIKTGLSIAAILSIENIEECAIMKKQKQKR